MRIRLGDQIMRNLHRTVVFFSVVAAMFAVGCPTVIEEVSAARQACLDLDYSDSVIDDLFDVANAQRADEIAREDAWDTTTADCKEQCDDSATCLDRCSACAGFIVDQIYD